MQKEQLSPVGKQLLDRVEFDSDEKILYEIVKHPFGLTLTYLTGFAVTAVMLVISLVIAITVSGMDTELDSGSGPAQAIIITLGLVLAGGSFIMTLIAAFLYKNNVILVTSDKLAQLQYTSIFHRKISQLSIGDIQDVTASQRGIFAHVFDYGSIVIETSGEQNNYVFSFVPKPYEASKAIVTSHESNLKLYGN